MLNNNKTTTFSHLNVTLILNANVCCCVHLRCLAETFPMRIYVFSATCKENKHFNYPVMYM